MTFRQAHAPQFFFGLFDGPRLLGFVNGTCCAGEELHHATMSECVCVKCKWIDVDGSRGYMPKYPRRRTLRLTHTRRFDYTQNTYRHDPAGPTLCIHSVVVTPERRKQGLATGPCLCTFHRFTKNE